MDDRRHFACVVSDPHQWTRVEPGVRRLPTVVEQCRALESWATRLGGRVDPTPVVVDRELSGRGPSSILDAARHPSVEGLLCFSTECITAGAGFEIAVVVDAWQHVDFIGFLVEDLAIFDADTLDHVLEMLVVVNQIAERDRDTRWVGLVTEGLRS